MKKEMYRNAIVPHLWAFAVIAMILSFAISSRSLAQEEISGHNDTLALTMDECIAIALENHFPLEIAKKQLKLAEFRLLEAMRKLGPTVTAKWETSGGQVAGAYYEGEKITFEGKQPLFYGGELVFSVRQAKVNLKIVKNDYDRIKNELILQVKKAYYSLDKAKKALLIQEGLYRGTKKLYEMARAGYEVDVFSEVEFLKVTSQKYQADFQSTSAREDLSIANLLLQQAMNIDEEIEIREVPEPEIVDLALDTCFSLARLNRPEIKISRLSLEYFDYEKKIMGARASWPRVDFLGMYGNSKEDFLSRDMVTGRDPRQRGPEFYYGFKASLPVWGSTLGYSFMEESWQPVVQTTKGTKSRTSSISFAFLDKLEDISSAKEADLEYARSKDEMDKKKQEIILEVKETFFKYKKSIILMSVSKSKVNFQSKQVAVLEVRRQLGEVLYSDVIEEMVKLAEERFSYVQAIADYYIAIASLNKAIGIDGYFEN
ncbi:MAG: TolC family protein [Candidatus Omnitrophota bacterium]